ncbi:hypothetical protein, partial [Chromobacterium subtsugae]|uniref:hypothetical protein n=1 Tax=Chromobacterium subtsugae TaxID=251747 RepID=UPI001C1278F4
AAAASVHTSSGRCVFLLRWGGFEFRLHALKKMQALSIYHAPADWISPGRHGMATRRKKNTSGT